jgi:hypothetical protein
MKNANQIKNYVLGAYIETQKHVFVSDLMKHFNTSASGIRSALGYDDFVFEEADRWQGSNMCGRYVLAPCVEPTKTYLASILKRMMVAA